MATLFAAVVAGGIAVAALVQRHRADKRDQWWKRAQWAMDLAIKGDLPAKSVGIQALTKLGESKLLARGEEEFLYEVGGAVQDLVIDSALEESQTGRRRNILRRPRVSDPR
ncbi:hypothetical protein [Arthrobacter ulcerisalmonis]|uniref:hypothetical protein n=1 Tax=Arthrobacter ulcerisalmonis TaxID=2483813 RepID=UPI00366F5B11